MLELPVIETLRRECLDACGAGRVADYIPELASANPRDLGVALLTLEGERRGCGDYQRHFTLQSIAKVITLLCCLRDNGVERLAKKVSLEPTGLEFNSIGTFEAADAHRPLNPMINAGAIALIPLLQGSTPDEKFDRILRCVRELCGNDAVHLNERVYRSEKDTASRNRALAYYMQSTGILAGNVEEILDVYFRVCSISVTCEDLARIGLILANGGKSPDGREHFPPKIAMIVKAIMMFCGLYNESGEYAVRVGMPSKSGVSGGILAVAPGRMGIGVWGPALNDKGTSVAGQAFLAKLSERLRLSVFA